MLTEEEENKWYPKNMDYQPACYKCRREAGKDAAGVKESSLCIPHLRARNAALEKAYAEFYRDTTKMMGDDAEKISALEAEVARLKIEVDVAESMSRHSPAPCGHSSQYCYTEDGGKHIICLLCEIARLRKALKEIEGHHYIWDNQTLQLVHLTNLAKAALEASDED